MSDSDVTIIDGPSATGTASSNVSTKRRSPVWAFFTIKSETDKNWVNCDLCDKKVKTKDSGTSNLFGHLKTHHPLRYAEIVKVSCASSQSKNKSTKTQHQPSLAEVIQSKAKYSKDSERHKVLTESILQYLVSGLWTYYCYYLVYSRLSSHKCVDYIFCEHNVSPLEMVVAVWMDGIKSKEN